MIRSSRRRVLSATAGLVGLGALAGCLVGGRSDGPADEGENGRTDGDDGPGESDVASLAFRRSTPVEPNAAFLLERAEATEWLDERGYPVDDGSADGDSTAENGDASANDTGDGDGDGDGDGGGDGEADADRVVAFLEETDFEAAAIVALEADAPTPCHELALEEATYEDGSFEAEAVVTDEDHGGDPCAAQTVTVGRLVRVTLEDPSEVALSVTIVDSGGGQHTFQKTLVSDEGSASTSTSSSSKSSSTSTSTSSVDASSESETSVESDASVSTSG
ncbi:hypothetical protein ACFQGT_04695 [Natrialbaceae archaeon GCM10025810]|uniref:hypothetical protein n=1 Tax=Halovalidus salilacus TaxID=3075124 RepID=UPI00360E694C